jgi:hypothetical protein
LAIAIKKVVVIGAVLLQNYSSSSPVDVDADDATASLNLYCRLANHDKMAAKLKRLFLEK